MSTDKLFYRLFETSPETLFLLLGLPPGEANATAARYQCQAIEFKETSHRVDGVFLPKEPGLPVYFVEVQFYRLASVFADLLVKAFTYLKNNDPSQPFFGVVLFASRSLEPTELTPYRPMLDAGLIRCFYLDEMPEFANAPLGLAILNLILEAEEGAPATAKELIHRTRTEVQDAALQADLVELIETVIIYKLTHLSREEIQTMLQVHDIRESRVYQEALKEGVEKGIKEGVEKGIKEGLEKGRQEALKMAIAMMAAKKQMSATEIAALFELDLEKVRQALNGTNGK